MTEMVKKLSEKDEIQTERELNPYENIAMLDKFLKTVPDHSVRDEKYELGLGCRYEHSFSTGLYIRKMFVPKGIIFVTTIHKTQHPLFVMQGDITIYADGKSKRVKAPYFHITEEGTQRALVTHEDTVGITCHVTEKTDVEEICKDIFVDTYEEFLKIDHDDYKAILDQACVTEEWTQRVMDTLENVEFPDGYGHLVLFPSRIHGTGLKTTKEIKAGNFVCPVNIEGVRTPAARYINHSKFNNCKMVTSSNLINLYAVKDIWAGQELTINYLERFKALKIIT